jgi:hypothetical protein
VSSTEIFIDRNKSGDLNIDFLTGSADNQPKTEGESTHKETTLPPARIVNFIIDEFAVNWSDEFPIDPVTQRFGPIVIAINDLNTLPYPSRPASKACSLLPKTGAP